MRVLHYASRSLATVALLGLAAGCGGDSTEPNAPFSAEGTRDDVEAISASFDAPALESFAAASVDIQATVGGSAALAIHAMPSAALATGGKSGALRYAASLAQRYRSGPRPSLSTASVPAEYQGVTFVWDVATDAYVASDLTGAPSNGARFLLYGVNPVTGQPIEPLVEVGYVDLTSSETATSLTARAVVVSGGVTYLDYTALITASGSNGVITISGFATNGTDRVNYDLETTFISDEQTGMGFVLDYLLVVPTRGGFRMDIESSWTGIMTDSPTITLNLTARGDNGTVSIEGSQTDASGSFQVEVNGDLFATITLDGEGVPVITGATGQPLTEAEQAAMLAIWVMFSQGFEFFETLTPII